MDTAHQHDIVVGVDGSDSAVVAATWAAREAQLSDASLLLLYTCLVPRVPRTFRRIVGPDLRGSLLSIGEEALELAREACVEDAPGVRCDVRVEVAPPAAALINASRHARLVVLGSRGLGGISGLLLGSVAASVSRQSACPVVIVRGGPVPDASLPVVVGVDGSPMSTAAVEFAFDFAARRRVPLVALCAGGSLLTDEGQAPIDAEIEFVLSEHLAGWREKYPDVEVRKSVVRGKPAAELVEAGASAQLVVVGSRGRGDSAARGLGSVSHALLHHGRCPVAIVRS